MPGNATLGHARPARVPAAIFWSFALLIDLALLLTLPRSPWVLVGLLALGVTIALVRHPAVLLAYLTAGTPLLLPVSDAWRSATPLVIYGLALVLLVVLLRVWNALWDPPRLRALVEVTRSSAWRFACVLGLLLWFGLRWTEAPIYGESKVQLYWISNVMLLSFALFVLAREAGEEGLPRSAPAFLRALLWLQVGIAVAGVVNALTGYYPYTDRLTTLGLNPIWVARHVGLGLLTAVLLRRLDLLPRALFWPLILLFGWVFLQAASRGPTLSLVVVLVVWYLATPGGRSILGAKGANAASNRRGAGASRWKRVAVVTAGGLLLAVPAILWVTSSQHAAGQTVSNQVRIWLLRAARRALAEITPLGLGPGGFSDFLGLPDRRWYPHNLFIEVTIENGLVGLALLLAFLGSTYAAWRRWGRSLGPRDSSDPESSLRLGIGMIFLFALLCAQFSGDIYVNEWVWAFAGVIVAWTPRSSG